MEQEFKTKKGWKIFGYTFCVVVIAIMLYFLIDAVLSNENILLWIGLNIASVLLFGYGMLAIYRGKIVLSSDAIIEYRAFRKKKLLFSEIKGFRIQGVMIVLEPKNRSKSRMVVGNISYTINGSVLATFLTTTFKDLDESDYNMEVSEAFNNPAIGENVEDREQRIKDARKVARFLNIGGLFIFLWLLLYPLFPHFYFLPIILGLLYPLVVMLYFLTHQQIVTLLDSGKKSVHPNLTTALYLAVGGLGLRLILQYHALNAADCVMPTALLAVALALLFVWLLRPSKARTSNLWVGLFFCIVYAIAGTGMVNCAFDWSRPTQYKARVLARSITTGKSTTYNLKLSAFGPRKEPEDESVPKSVYYSIKTGDNVTVYVKEGYLNIPWYFVE
jgi:hypothetical protein